MDIKETARKLFNEAVMGCTFITPEQGGVVTLLVSGDNVQIAIRTDKKQALEIAAYAIQDYIQQCT